MATALASTMLNPLGDFRISGIQAQRIRQVSTIYGPAISGSGDVTVDTGIPPRTGAHASAIYDSEKRGEGGGEYSGEGSCVSTSEHGTT